MENIPRDVQLYILKFLISFDDIVFKENDISNIYELWSNYNPRYKVAFYKEDRRLFNGKYLLSRIEKSNGNHRYYFTKEMIELTCYDCNYNYKMTNELPNVHHISSLSLVSVSHKIHGSCSRWCPGSMDIVSKYSSFYVGNEKNLFNVFVIYLCL